MGGGRLKAVVVGGLFLMGAWGCSEESRTDPLTGGTSSSQTTSPERTTRERDEPADQGETPEFAIVAGQDGVAVVDGSHVVPLEELAGAEFGIEGAFAVPLDGSTAAVLLEGTLATVTAEGVVDTAECNDCAGLAVSNGTIVTTRRNLQPGNGFDIVSFSPELETTATVPARRLDERAEIDFVPENTESPVTYAASPDRVTVGYLSLNGGIRAGPSIVAQYSYDGELLDSVTLDGILGRAAVSPDSRFLALGVGGSGGACITLSELVVVRLDDLETLDSGPSVPSEAAAQSAGLEDPWLLLTDLLWNGPVLHTMGQVFQTGNVDTGDGVGADCEVPQAWSRRFDAESGDFSDVPAGNLRATRWLGPECGDVLEVVGWPDPATAVTRIGGQEAVLGSYSTVALGRPKSGEC